VNAKDDSDQPPASAAFFLHVQNVCVVTDNYRCDRDDSDTSNYSELPTFTHLTKQTDSDSYETSFQIDRVGNVTASVVLAQPGGLYAEYFNNAFMAGVPTQTQIDSFMAFDWADGMITPEAGDFASVQWFGKLLPPTQERYSFVLKGDQGFKLFIDGKLLIDRWDTCCDEMSASIDLETRFYDIVVMFKDETGKASFSVEWFSNSLPREVLSYKYLYYSSRVVEETLIRVVQGPSIPAKCTIQDAPVVLTSGKLSSSIFRSRNSYGTVVDNQNDLYTMKMENAHRTLYFYAVYQEEGQYRVDYVPEAAGDFQVSITLFGKHINGSPYEVTVLPGEVSSLKSYTDIVPADLLTFKAGTTYRFRI
jgi:hypothetical protein